MKKALTCVLFCLFILALSHTASAVEQGQIYEYQIEKYGVSDINNVVPDGAEEFAEDQPLQLENVGQLFDIQKIISRIVNVFFNLLAEKKSFFIQLTALLILLYIVKSLCSGLSRDSTVRTLTYFAVICTGILVFESVFDVSHKLTDALEQQISFTTAALPVMTGLVNASGLPVSAAGIGATSAFILNLLAMSVVWIIPAVNTYMVLGLGTCLSENENLKAVSVFFRNTCIFIITLLFCVFIGVISLQSTFTGAADSVSKRAITFTAGNFVPIAGGYISEGINTVFSCAASLKANVGTFVSVVLFFTAAAPIADIAVNILLLSAAKMLCSFFSNKRLSALFNVIKDAFAMLLVIAIGAAFMLVICMTVMAKIGG